MISNIVTKLNKNWVFNYENLRPVEGGYAVDFNQMKGETLSTFTLRVTNTISVMSGNFRIYSAAFEFSEPMFAIVEFAD